MGSTPLNYATPATVRRGAVQCGLFAHVLASYVVGVVLVGWALSKGAPFEPVMLLLVAATPMWVPLIPLFGVVFLPDPVFWGSLCAAYAPAVVLTYWYLRKPREA